MHATTPDLSRIAQDLQIRKVQVENVVQLLDEGNTVPFITRYRKERTGGLDEEVIRTIQQRMGQLRQLAERKQTIVKSIENQGKLTDELRNAIQAAETPRRLEDLYLPYKPKKKSLASTARERGLEPLALAIWNRDPAVGTLAEILPTLVNPEKELPTPEDVLLGVQHILAELIAETAAVRAGVRSTLWQTGKVCTAKNEARTEEQSQDYKDYFEFNEGLRQIPPHRILAINRGEKEGVLKVRLEWDNELVQKVAREPLPLAGHPHAEFLDKVAADALTRLVLPSLEREIRRELTGEAESHAVHVFARNLRSLVLQRPLKASRVLAIDPGFRTGCKLAVLDETGNLVNHGVIHPHAPQNHREEAKAKLIELVREHRTTVIAIGNGSACRETEELVSDVIGLLARGENVTLPPPRKPPVVVPRPAPAAAEQPPAAPEAPAPDAAKPIEATGEATAGEPAAAPPVPDSAPAEVPAPAAEAAAPAPEPAVEEAPIRLPNYEPVPDVAYVIVNEAGASVYSASAIGREEFPDYDATLRGTISIGRRLQDPLSELVKVDPQNIGVGLYQHDVNPKELKETLEAVIESCVNHVGVDLNTASVPLLRHVSGLNQLAARELVDYRNQNGPFRTRDQLLNVQGIGPARWTQAAGFLKILGGDNPLDQTWIHPESYPTAQQVLTELGYGPDALLDRAKTDELKSKLTAVPVEELGQKLNAGVPTVYDIVEALGKPGRDPREDLPPPIFKKGILKLEDLTPGMELKGTVLNVVDFGAFVDIGLKDSGLVHISQMANRYIKNPYDVAAVGDVVTVWVMTVDMTRRRVSLSMIKPGTERKPPEKKPAREARPPRDQGPRPPRDQEQRPRPPQGRRPPPRPPQQGRPAAPAAPAGPPAPPRQLVIIPPKPRKPSRPRPAPKLSKAALEGAAPLRTFGELEVFFKVKREESAPPPPPDSPSEPGPAANPPAENPPPESTS